MVAESARQALDRNEGETVGVDVARHFLDVHLAGDELRTLRRIDAIEAAELGRRRGDAHVNLPRPGLAPPLDDLHRSRAANDTVVDEHDALALDQRSIGVVLELHPKVPDVLARLEKGPPNIVGTDDPQLKRNAGFPTETKGGRDAGIRNGDDQISLDGRLASQLCADVLSDLVNRSAL